MKVLISQYIRTLKERNELDRLLPNLLLSMDIVPLFTTQTGTRQYGVDIAAIGKDPDDGEKKLFIFVIKQKDLGRSEWDSGPQSIRQSLNEVFDVYLRNHLQPKHKKLPKKIILSTSGDMKEEINQNWAGYLDEHKSHEFDFWGADKLSTFIEKYMLNEHIFNDIDRTDLRKSLSLISENDYSRIDFHRLLLRILMLDNEGKKIKEIKRAELEKSIRTCYLAANILAYWAIQDGNTKQALFVSERCLLWVWHRINLEKDPKKYFPSFEVIWQGYINISAEYFSKLQPYFHEKYLLSLYSTESSLVNITVFEHIGILATIGLNNFLIALKKDNNEGALHIHNADIVADSLCALIINNPASGSPRLDENVIEITLGLIFLSLMGRKDTIDKWLRELISRLDYVLRIGREHPISTDSIDDLISMECNSDDTYLKEKTTSMSWMIPTLMGWCVILEKEEGYYALLTGTKESYTKICSQLWHPTNDLYKHLYFHPAQSFTGETEAPITFPDNMSYYKNRMDELRENERYNIFKESSAVQAGLTILDFIACRHFRTPVPSVLWYGMQKKQSDN
ncbi:hypothetical protein FNH73_23360 [Salmonella enterica subsp. salamae]|uniref:Uncharacterized protein n=1 Tax=Salmonella enterica subsp. salamae serovar 42:f,g,t:-- TaxID=41518 RepID=A0A737H6G8_SALER|nr:hypothetical protein [Salmonella enterica]EAA8842662.1 hypothetical protein [Salmonella enterica subsp. enterica]ECE6010248.1 hypothetical protein [Salmonella enterica subsp. salamae]EDU6435626.1 hypothetical protein [Salmonella enterica subsp. salamae serovar 47:b:e,n,x,z15]EAP4934981.1 hypothetical protein [Salmonella enterica]EAW0072882.1 hypothetical protein [Salmonella enterica]